jgi:hypothetical protein
MIIFLEPTYITEPIPESKTSTLMMEAVRSSERSVSTHKTTWYRNPEDHNLDA